MSFLKKKKKTKSTPPIRSSSRGQLAPSDPLSLYLAQIQKYPVMTREEEYELAVKYRETHDRVAAQRLVTANLRFVVKIAGEYAKFGSNILDLIQEGNKGLMVAVREFNPYKGNRLITYAAWWIRGQIQEYLMHQYSVVKIGTTQAQRKLFYRLKKHQAELEKLGYEEGVKQLSGSLGVREKDTKMMALRLSGRDMSLQKPLYENSSSKTLIDVQTQENEKNPAELLEKQENIHLLKKAVSDLKSELSERENYLLENRLLAEEPLTLQNIGNKYKITREAVRQIETRLVEKIKKRLQTTP